MNDKHLINYKIRTTKIKIVNIEPNKVFTFYEAMEIAKNRGEDLIQVGFDLKSDTAICQIMEYGKYKYQQEKNKKSNSTPEMKEFRFSLNISDHDIDTKINHAKELMEKKHPIKITIYLKEWQKAQFPQAEELYTKIKEKIGSNCVEQSKKTNEKQINGIFVQKLK